MGNCNCYWSDARHTSDIVRRSVTAVKSHEQLYNCTLLMHWPGCSQCIYQPMALLFKHGTPSKARGLVTLAEPGLPASNMGPGKGPGSSLEYSSTQIHPTIVKHRYMACYGTRPSLSKLESATKIRHFKMTITPNHSR